jgi:hypothetical protein
MLVLKPEKARHTGCKAVPDAFRFKDLLLVERCERPTMKSGNVWRSDEQRCASES